MEETKTSISTWQGNQDFCINMARIRKESKTSVSKWKGNQDFGINMARAWTDVQHARRE